jgi:Fe-S-cluster containining protein
VTQRGAERKAAGPWLAGRLPITPDNAPSRVRAELQIPHGAHAANPKRVGRRHQRYVPLGAPSSHCAAEYIADTLPHASAREYPVVVVTDLVEIRRLGSAKKNENLGFRRYLSAHQHRVEELQSLAAQIQPQIDCTTCANCCRCGVVEVHRGDVEALARHVGVSFEEATRAYTRLDPENPGTRVLKNTHSGCVFVRGNLCAVYPARPKACRDFPHLSFGTHSLGSRISSLARWIPICPIVYNAFESYKRAVGYHPPDHAA